MTAREYLQVAVGALRLNLMRSILTTLGIIIGVGSVIVMGSVGRGASLQIEKQIASLGTDVLTLSPGSSRQGGFMGGAGTAPPLSEKDMRALRSGVPGIAAMSGNMNGSATVVAGNANWVTFITGAHAEFLQVRNWPLKAGRFFTEEEVQGGRKVAVLGSTTARELYGTNDPVGSVIRVKNVPFEVIGVLAPRGQAMMGRDQDDTVILPISAARSRVIGGSVTVPDQVGSILIKVQPGYDTEQVQNAITDLMRERRRIQPGEQDNFGIRNFAEMMQARTETMRTLGLLLGATAAISLIVGGIGIMNIMLVSVTERTREIGLRMSIGARRRDILAQFLTEAILLCVFGGLLGLLLGVGIAFAVSTLGDWPMVVSPFVVGLAIVASLAVGVIFGFVPARRAAQLNPIDALRYE